MPLIRGDPSERSGIRGFGAQGTRTLRIGRTKPIPDSALRAPSGLRWLNNLATENTENTEEYGNCAAGSGASAPLAPRALPNCPSNPFLLRVLCVLRG